jgi:hypothetical protein
MGDKIKKIIKYRIKEEKYVSEKSKFFPQVLVGDDWKILSYNIMGFNDNGVDWCTTLEDSKKLIERYHIIINSNGVDKIVEEKIYNFIENEHLKTEEVINGIKYTTHYIGKPIKPGDPIGSSIGACVNGINTPLEVINYIYRTIN